MSSLIVGGATPSAVGTVHGNVHGGQQPLVGAHVYVYAAATNGYGAASTSLLTNVPTLTTMDGNGHYFVTTASNGSFSITGEYLCTSGTQVYLFVTGGDAGAGVNTASGLLAALGQCPATGTLALSVPFVWVNEVSTVAAAYALAGFAADATHIGSSGTALAQQGLANAFANVTNLANVATGAALATTPAGNGTVDQKTVNTVANILAACVNSPGPNSGACSTLLGGVQNTGTAPAETATAAIAIAQNPGYHVPTLYGLQTGVGAPFVPALSVQPNDFSVGISFTGGGLNGGDAIAVDGTGNVWVADSNNAALTKFSSLGVPLSPSNGFAGGGLASPTGIAIDLAGNVWAANGNHHCISEHSNAGAAISPSTGFQGGGLNYPFMLAIDGSNNVWVGDGSVVRELSSSGVFMSPTGGYSAGAGLVNATGIAVDSVGNVWVSSADPSNGSIVKFNNAGVALSGTNGYTGGGLESGFAYTAAIDGAGNAWTYSERNFVSAVTKISNAGVVLSPTGGYGLGGGAGGDIGYNSTAIDGAGGVWISNNGGRNSGAGSVAHLTNSGVAVTSAQGLTSGGIADAEAIAIDGSGDVWVPNYSPNTVTELIGVAAPVATPLAYGVSAGKLGSRP